MRKQHVSHFYKSVLKEHFCKCACNQSRSSRLKAKVYSILCILLVVAEREGGESHDSKHDACIFISIYAVRSSEAKL